MLDYSMIYFWVAVIVVAAAVEASTVNLVSIWFALGAVVPAILAAFGVNVWVQVIVFLVISIVLVIFTRPLVRKYIKPRSLPTNADRIIGMVGVVSEEVDNLKPSGMVNVGGQSWTARSRNGVIPEGTEVRVLNIEGVKAIVAPLPKSEKAEGSSEKA